MPEQQDVKLDFSKAQPISQPVTLDFSKSQPIAEQAAAQEKEGHISPIEGESFEQTMKRGAEFGKKVTPEQLASSVHEGLKKVPTVLGAALFSGPALIGGLAVGPAAASSAAGGGALGGAAGGAVGGASSSLIDKLLHGAGGEPVATKQNLFDVGAATATGAATGFALGLFDKVTGSLLNSKLSRGMVNASVGTTARDVTYGNPAVGIMKAGVTSPFTGDLEAYKGALRSGATPEQALVSAGGRVSEVANKVQELSPQLDQALSASKATLKVSDIIDKPLMDSMKEIMSNRAMTEAEKDAAVTQIGALQQSLKEGLGPTISPFEANSIKQAIGNRVNWAGNVAIGDEVKPTYRALYGTIKNAVNKAVPEAAGINEDLTNLLSAQTDLEKLMKAEEAGQGKGALGSAVTGIARRFEAVLGRAIPSVAAAQKAFSPVPPVAATGASIGEQLLSKGRQLPTASPNQPGQPFNPGAGISR
jgi:hypothetical protein